MELVTDLPQLTIFLHPVIFILSTNVNNKFVYKNIYI